MIPVVTPEEMGAIDAAAPEPVEVLIDRAGQAVAGAAVDMLGGTYGRRVVVLAGKGNNGADGRVAGRRLEQRGVRVEVVEAADNPTTLPVADLVIDAAYGTGLTRAYHPPPTEAPVLAVDIPSGVNGLTGEIPGSVLAADRTVTFAALKPGLLLGPGAQYVGDLEVVDIGLDVSGARASLVTDDAVRAVLEPRNHDAHKWQSAVWVIGGSLGMAGAAHLAAAAAARAGAGYVRLSTPGADAEGPVEAVVRPLPATDWSGAVLADLDRMAALAIGPGLGREAGTEEAVRAVVAAADVPVVVDGDGLHALGDDPASVLAGRPAPTVLTPHDGEFARLAGRAPGVDRLQAARDLAAEAGAHVLLKGPATVVAMPGGRAVIATAGDARLATAGTGDVLTGIIVGLLARGLDPVVAAGAGAHIHGLAGSLGPRAGLVASDLVTSLPEVLDFLVVTR